MKFTGVSLDKSSLSFSAMTACQMPVHRRDAVVLSYNFAVTWNEKVARLVYRRLLFTLLRVRTNCKEKRSRSSDCAQRQKGATFKNPNSVM